MLKTFHILTLLASLGYFSSCAIDVPETSYPIIEASTNFENFQALNENDLNNVGEHDLKTILKEKKFLLNLLENSRCSSIKSLQDSIYEELRAVLNTNPTSRKPSINFAIIKIMLETAALDSSSKYYGKTSAVIFEHFYESFYFFLPNGYQKKVFKKYQNMIDELIRQLLYDINKLKKMQLEQLSN